MEFEERYLQVQTPKYDCLLFDLDDTLYSFSSGIAEACGRNIKCYMDEELGIEKTKLSELSSLLYKNYGTTMAGLRAIGYDFDYDEYHSFVHGRLPYENLKADPILRNLLQSLPIRKVIFTNADRTHALKVLQKLGLEGCFEGILCFETLNPTHKTNASDDEDDAEFLGSSTNNNVKENEQRQILDIVAHLSHQDPTFVLPKTPIACKPSESAMARALKIANLDATRTLFFDDSVRNIQSGKRIGLHTVLVGSSQRIKGSDYALESIHNLKEALPELWEAEVKTDVGYTAKFGAETSVTA